MFLNECGAWDEELVECVKRVCVWLGAAWEETGRVLDVYLRYGGVGGEWAWTKVWKGGVMSV